MLTPTLKFFIVGDFNVDFKCTTPVTKLLTDFTSPLLCFPTFIPSSASSPKVPGWKDTGTDKLREMSIFWHRVWVEAGYPCSGVMFNIKRNGKKRFKYAVRRLKRRRDYLVREKLASAFSTKDKNRFWSEVRRLNHIRKSSAPSIDDTSDIQQICQPVCF